MSDDEITIGGDTEDIPPGMYPAKLFAISTKQSVAFGDFRAWDFLLDQKAKDGGQLIVGGASSMNTGSKSKGGKWIAALLGRVPAKGEKVAAAILGKPCTVQIIEADGWPKVENVLPPMTAQQAAATVTEAAGASPSPAAAPVADLPF